MLILLPQMLLLQRLIATTNATMTTIHCYCSSLLAMELNNANDNGRGDASEYKRIERQITHTIDIYANNTYMHA